MDTVVEDKDVLFPQVFTHLASVEAQPLTKLDEDLLKRAERSLDASTSRQVLWRLLSTGEKLLQTLQQDPRPLTRLLERDVLFIPFDELKTTISAEKLEEGLQSTSIPVQLLCLAYLKKAADQPSGAAFVAASSSLVQYLVSTWLSSESTEVSERALEVIVALLAVDSPDSITVVMADRQTGEAQGQGLLWRRIFHDPDVYSLMYEWTSTRNSKHDLRSKKGSQQLTISQARLFDFIERVSQLEWATITTSTLPNVESRFIQQTETESPYGGLLRYAASNMIDQSDILMEVLRQDFFVKLLEVVESNSSQVSQRQIQAIQQDAGIDNSEQEKNDGLHL